MAEGVEERRSKRRPPCNGADRASVTRGYPTRKGADLYGASGVKSSTLMPLAMGQFGSAWAGRVIQGPAVSGAPWMSGIEQLAEMITTDLAPRLLEQRLLEQRLLERRLVQQRPLEQGRLVRRLQDQRHLDQPLLEQRLLEQRLLEQRLLEQRLL